MPEPLQLDRAFGRQAFGADPANYHAARPPYPGWVFETLRDVCGVRAGSHVFEIGAGAGKATGPLLALGADPLVAIEPDARLADFLRAAFPGSALDVTTQTFEDVELEAGAFDLGLSATAFHWLDEGPALAKIARSLRAGGWWAALWNNFGDDAYPDLFHLATQGVLAGPASPGEGQRGIPFGLDAAARIAAIDATGAFERVLYYTSHWPLVLTADQTVALYATYSNVTALPNAADALAELRRIAETEFPGGVTRNMTTILYLARRA
ncbi:class I SAM-dependent methyltransferase [Caulobacter sp. KR2-114]|uniref:class I SAM-dependent methyltransferase n=1 Tax=Caulobacter sp. KR2-114 TaxID=3400912 RepID=UPI003C084A8B